MQRLKNQILQRFSHCFLSHTRLNECEQVKHMFAMMGNSIYVTKTMYSITFVFFWQNKRIWAHSNRTVLTTAFDLRFEWSELNFLNLTLPSWRRPLRTLLRPFQILEFNRKTSKMSTVHSRFAIVIINVKKWWKFWQFTFEAYNGI